MPWCSGSMAKIGIFAIFPAVILTKQNPQGTPLYKSTLAASGKNSPYTPFIILQRMSFVPSTVLNLGSKRASEEFSNAL